jgi:hypothetical protein
MTPYWKANGKIASRLRHCEAQHPILFLELHSSLENYRDTYQKSTERWGTDAAEDGLEDQLQAWWNAVIEQRYASKRTAQREIIRRIGALWELAVKRAKGKRRDVLSAFSHVVLVGDVAKDKAWIYEPVNRKIDIHIIIRTTGGRCDEECYLEFGVFTPGIIGGKEDRKRMAVIPSNLALLSLPALEAVEDALLEFCRDYA